MGEHGYRPIPVEQIRKGDYVLSVHGRRKVTNVVQTGDRYALHLAGERHPMQVNKGQLVEMMRS